MAKNGQRRLICFDWDGTLADSMNLCVQEIRLALERCGLPPVPEEVIRRCNGPIYQESTAVLGLPPERAEEFLAARFQAEMEIVASTQRLFPGVKEMLLALCPEADLAIVSNGLPDYLSRSLQVTGLAGLFTQVRPLCPGLSKAQSLAALLAETQPVAALMVGDRAGDLQAGKSCGLTTVAAAYGYGTAEEWALADAVAEQPMELVRLLPALLEQSAAH